MTNPHITTSLHLLNEFAQEVDSLEKLLIHQNVLTQRLHVFWKECAASLAMPKASPLTSARENMAALQEIMRKFENTSSNFQSTWTALSVTHENFQRECARKKKREDVS